MAITAPRLMRISQSIDTTRFSWNFQFIKGVCFIVMKINKLENLLILGKKPSSIVPLICFYSNYPTFNILQYF